MDDTQRERMYRQMIWLGVIGSLLLFLTFRPYGGVPLSFYFYLMLWITMASSMNIMAGFTGYIPFGFVAFYGIGAYVTAICISKLGLPIVLSLGIAGLVSVAFSLLLAPTLKLRGIYFAMVSLGLAMICKLMISETPESVSGGSFGLILAKSNDPSAAYLAMGVVMAGAIVTTWLIANSRLGIALRAIRDDPEAAEMLGINVAKPRLIAWMATAIFPALAGGIEAWYTNLVDPEAAFNILVSAKSLIYGMVGGLGTLVGPIIGATVMMFVDNLVWQTFPLFNLFFLGLLIVVIMLFVPRGLVGAIAMRWPNLRRYIP